MQDPFSGLENTLGAQGMATEDCLGSPEQQLVQRLNKEEEVRVTKERN